MASQQCRTGHGEIDTIPLEQILEPAMMREREIVRRDLMTRNSTRLEGLVLKKASILSWEM